MRASLESKAVEVVAVAEVVDIKAAVIVKLHDEIGGHLKMSVEKAVKIGELLTEQKAALAHGEWLPWCGNLPFGQKTINNYMRCYDIRAKLVSVTNLTEAYRLIEAPKKGKQTEKKKPKDETKKPEPKTRMEAPPGEQEQTDEEGFTESGDEPVRANNDGAERESPKDALLNTLHEVKDNVDCMIGYIHTFTDAHGDVDRAIFKQFTAEEKEGVRELVRRFDDIRETMDLIRKSTGRSWLNNK